MIQMMVSGYDVLESEVFRRKDRTLTVFQRALYVKPWSPFTSITRLRHE